MKTIHQVTESKDIKQESFLKPGDSIPRMTEDSIDIPDEEIEGEDLDTEEDGEIPESFLFESKIIFLSNLTEIPGAVGDRCLSIGLHYTKNQALDLIESKLDGLCPEYPELDLETKKKIVAFMRKYQGQTKRISFRSFIHIATIYMSGSPDWEKWALIQMKSLPD